jgi:anti-anti-sigma factor
VSAGSGDDCRRRCSPLPSAGIDEPLTAEVTESDDVTVIHVRGEVAYSTCRILQDALVPHVGPGRRIVLDFAEVTLLDSSGIGVILKAQRALDEVEGTLVVRNPAPVTLKVLEVTGLQDLLVERPRS